MRYELKHLIQHDRLPSVSAAVEVKTWDPDVRKGIELLVDITNDGAEPVDLYDPTEHIFISLRNRALDPSGHSVSLPAHPLRGSSIDIKDAEMQARTIAEIKAKRPFQIVRDEPRRRARNIKGVDDVEGEENGVVRLEPGEHFQARLRFTQIMAEPQKYWAEREKPRPTIPKEYTSPHPPDVIPPHLSKAVPIPEGAYQLSVFISLNTPAIAAEERGMSSERTTTDDPPIKVLLGPKPEPGE